MARKAKPKKIPVRGIPPQVTDAVTQVLVMILGSGPSIAAFESVLAAAEADGLIYQNANDNQQKSELLAMAMTAKCVRYMLGSPKASPARAKRKR